MSTKLTKTTLNEAIFDAVKSIQPDVLRMLLKLEGGDVNAINWKTGSTPLSYATCYATKEIVTILLDNGADVNVMNSIGETPLHVAAWTGRVDILTILLDNGINRIIQSEPEFHKKFDAFINAKNRSGYTPMDMACWNNSDDAAILLMEKGGNTFQFQPTQGFFGMIISHLKKQAKEKDGEIERLKLRVADLVEELVQTSR